MIVEDGPEKKLSAILKTLEPCMSGGRLDTGKLSRSSSNISDATLLRQNSSDVRLGLNREDSQNSIGISRLEVDDDDGLEEDNLKGQDARSYLQVISAFKQPRYVYSTSKKSFELISSPPSLFPPVHHKIQMFQNRYQSVHQRLLRNEAFQAPSFATSMRPPNLVHSGSGGITMQQAYKITPISNLLGRAGSSHLLLGMLVNSATGDLALTDLSGSVVVDTSLARTVPEDAAWFCPGMMVLIEGTYEEDGSNNSNLGGSSGVGGQIKGRFVAETIAGPPAERRDITIGTGHRTKLNNVNTSVGAGFGWIDFLGVGSEKAIGQQMRRLRSRLIGKGDVAEDEQKRSKIVVLGECHLDNPRTLEAIRSILNSYTTSEKREGRPFTIVFMGNFRSAASMAGSGKGGGSIEYKECFDGLASVLSEFPSLLSCTTLVFVPGDNDPWASSFSAGAAVVLPRQGIPELFTSRIKRAIATANNEASHKEEDAAGEAIWTSNPTRLSLFGPVEEIVLFRDDITGRLRRNAVLFSTSEEEAQDHEMHDGVNNVQKDINEAESIHIDLAVEEAASHLPNTNNKRDTGKAEEVTARKLVKTILDQGHLAPFPLSIRPTFWDYAPSLSLYPLPTALVLADSEIPAFTVTYEGCHVMNPGRMLDEMGARKGLAKWLEYSAETRRGEIREIRF